MIRKASALTDAVIRERREITVTGRLIGDIGLRGGRVLMVQVDGETDVEVGPA